MIPLLFITGLLALVSGSLKIFGKGGRTTGFSIWALFELAAGGIVPFFAWSYPAPPAVLGLLLFFTLFLILFSSSLQLSRTRASLRHREETEAARLNVWVKYLSREIDEGQGGGDPSEGQGRWGLPESQGDGGGDPPKEGGRG